MTQVQRVSIIASTILCILILGGAFTVSQHQKKSTVAAQPLPLRPVTKVELKKSDGKNGHVCFVAVDGMVYKIDGFTLWQNGKHTSSEGLAYCGADLSDVIDKAPHGRSKLDVLIKVGPLKG
jgi:predicted heme/steroid binding protein